MTLAVYLREAWSRIETPLWLMMLMNVAMYARSCWDLPSGIFAGIMVFSLWVP